MTSIIMPREKLGSDDNESPTRINRHCLRPLARWLMMGAMGLMLIGCGSPPAVSPLLQVAGKAITQEIAQQETDALRESQFQRERQETLQQAFADDLTGRSSLDVPWVKSAADVYAQAMAEIVRHEETLKAQRRQRIDNLRVAAEAQTRALQLIELQDQWLLGTLGLDLWRLQQSRLLNELND